MGKHDRYPEEVAAFIIAHSTEYSAKGITEELKRRFGFERNYEAVHGWITRRHLRMKPMAGREFLEKSKYPAEMRDYIRRIAWGRSYKEIMQLVNEKFGEGTIEYKNLHTYLKNHKIKTGRTGKFKKGNVSWNKGKRFEDIVKDPYRRKRWKESQYKKGNMPMNTLPIGSIVKNKDGYLLRKRQIEGTQWERWELLHRAVWEEHNGPIPKDMLIIFKDGDKTNCDISNLELITRAEHIAMTRMQFRSTDPEATEAGLQVVRIIQQCKELEKVRK